MNKKEFLDKYKGKAVHCPTEDLANEFLGLAFSFGIRFWDRCEKNNMIGIKELRKKLVI